MASDWISGHNPRSLTSIHLMLQVFKQSIFFCFFSQTLRAAIGLDEVHQRVRRTLTSLADTALEIAYENMSPREVIQFFATFWIPQVFSKSNCFL